MALLGFTPPASEGDDNGRARRLTVHGRLTIANIQIIASDLRALPPAGQHLTIDLAAVERIDTAGAWIIHKLMQDWQAAGVEVALAGESKQTPFLGVCWQQILTASRIVMARKERSSFL